MSPSLSPLSCPALLVLPVCPVSPPLVVSIVLAPPPGGTPLSHWMPVFALLYVSFHLILALCPSSPVPPPSFCLSALCFLLRSSPSTYPPEVLSGLFPFSFGFLFISLSTLGSPLPLFIFSIFILSHYASSRWIRWLPRPRPFPQGRPLKFGLPPLLSPSLSSLAGGPPFGLC